ncbi:DUF397 domain-containing protein [Streptomyces sp. NPDC059092]|uniref:DUF397 domain-containing protein n=1 Tax=Streptomyces sp. NPDC059092 TaxID=3346725 RepID=UPI0036ACAD16
MQYEATESVWRRSSYSSGNGQCVEVRDNAPGAVPVRDSKNPGGPRLAFGSGAWTSFVAALRADDGSEV